MFTLIANIVCVSLPIILAVGLILNTVMGVM